jgi:hypothetical protein
MSKGSRREGRIFRKIINKGYSEYRNWNEHVDTKRVGKMGTLKLNVEFRGREFLILIFDENRRADESTVF